MGVKAKQGRVIRRYRHNIPIEDFDKWKELIRSRARGYGLYALYDNERLVYVGLATKSIRSRIESHIKKGGKQFTHFSVFLVTGKSQIVQARRIRDLEALLLNMINPPPIYNQNKTKFIGAKELELDETEEQLAQ